jgi:hypothetical protein
MAEYTDEQWDAILASAENSGLWSIDDTKILRGLIDSTHTFGLHLLGMILDQRNAVTLSLVAAPMLTDEHVRQINDFKGQIKGVDSILSLIRELAQKDVE